MIFKLLCELRIEGPARWMQVLVSFVAPFGVWLALLSAPAYAAQDFSGLSYEPVALGWSAAEVERVSARQARSIIEQAAHDGELGCRDYCARLQALFDRLLPIARAQSATAERMSWSLTVVRSASVEALSLPGGTLIVSEAFVRHAQLSDVELAFVLAHEMAHSALEHERQALTFARVLLSRDVSRTVVDIYTEIDYNFSLLKAMEIVLQQGEFEADELGLLMASAAGFSPRGQLGFLERLADQNAKPRQLVSTHPVASQRLQQLQSRLPLAERVFEAAQSAKP